MMNMDYTYLYDFNKNRYSRLNERNFLCKEDLASTVVETGYLLPTRYADHRLFGHGGVADSQKKYVKASEMNAYAKYADAVREIDEAEIYLGEGY